MKKVNFSTYKNFEVIDIIELGIRGEVQLDSYGKDVIIYTSYIFDRDLVVLGDLTNKRVCFKGAIKNVIIKGTGSPKLLVVGNDVGNVDIEKSVDIEHTTSIIANSGVLHIRYVKNLRSCIHLHNRNGAYINCGFVYDLPVIDGTKSLWIDTDNGMSTNFVFDKKCRDLHIFSDTIPYGTQFNNSGCVSLNVHTYEKPNVGGVIGDGVAFNNSGDVALHGYGRVGYGLVFRNRGDFSFYSRNDATLIDLHDAIIENGRDVNITGKIPFDDVVVTPMKSNLEFNNGRNVNFSYVIVRGYNKMNNRGDVQVLESILSSGRFLEFNNTGSVFFVGVEFLCKNKRTSFPTFNNGGTVSIQSHKKSEVNKAKLNNGGYVICSDGVLSKKGSYLKRYNVPVSNGFVTLVKGINAHGIASYDGNKDVVWGFLDDNRCEDWNPYENEIGNGKFVASYDGSVFSSIMNEHARIKYVAVSVHVSDLFEWSLCPKYPMLIGFRHGKVLYECDIKGNKIE